MSSAGSRGPSKVCYISYSLKPDAASVAPAPAPVPALVKGIELAEGRDVVLTQSKFTFPYLHFPSSLFTFSRVNCINFDLRI